MAMWAGVQAGGPLTVDEIKKISKEILSDALAGAKLGSSVPIVGPWVGALVGPYVCSIVRVLFDKKE